jgi:phosphatidylglycerophosphate synthase
VALVCGFVDEAATSVVAMSAVWIGLVVTTMDGVDGWLARRTRMAGPFGARFDMEVDALLILALAVLVWQHGKAGPWVVASGLLRYMFVIGGWMTPRMRRPLPDSRRRQTICVVQIAGLLIALWPGVVPPVSDIVSAAALLVLVCSFAVDTWWLLSDRRQQVA